MSLPLVSPYFNSPLSQITPFTYRDGETFLEQLKRLRCWIDEVTTALESNIEKVASDDAAAIAALADDLNNILSTFITDWQAKFLALLDQDIDIAFDPTTGNVDTINVVIGHVYDNTRYYAYFADQLDSFNYTASQWDALQYSARHFDLALAYSPTTTQATDVIPPTATPN